MRRSIASASSAALRSRASVSLSSPVAKRTAEAVLCR
jgi:hypothetical protein